VFFYLFKVVLEEPFSSVTDVVFSEKLRNLLVKSLTLSLCVAIVSTSLGLIFSLLIERTNLWFKKIWHVLIILSMAMPSYVLAYAWVDKESRFASFFGAFIILTLVTIPFAYLSIRSSVRKLDIQMEEIAGSLGSSRSNTLFKIVLPQLKRAVLTSMIISILYVLTDFGAVSTLRVEVFTWVIYNSYRAGFSPERAAILSCVLFVVAIMIVAIEGLVSKNKDLSQKNKSKIQSKRFELGAYNLVAQIGLSMVIGASLIFPIAQSISWTFTYRSVIDTSALLFALRNTVFLGLATMAISTLIAFSISLVATKSKFGESIVKLVMAMHSIPGIVTAIAFVFIGTRVVPSIYLEWYLLIVALCVTFSYLAIGPLRGLLIQRNEALQDTSFSLGRGKYYTLFKITIPLCVSGLRASAILVFIATIKELPITLILRPNEENTLATQLWSNLGVAKYGVVAPSMLMLIGLSMIPLMFLLKEKYG